VTSVDAAGPILLCYDGSDDAREAIDTAAAVFEGGEAVVGCFWQPLAHIANRFAVNLLELVQDPESVNEREAMLAQHLADEGAELATKAGLHAKGRAIEVSLPIDEAIIAYADELDAQLIVLGSRGRSSIASMLLGDVANDVVQRSNRPVFLVPSSRLANRRREELSIDAPSTPHASSTARKVEPAGADDATAQHQPGPPR
jgi:nucleotide-binding universal stress UspA family protein